MSRGNKRMRRFGSRWRRTFKRSKTRRVRTGTAAARRSRAAVPAGGRLAAWAGHALHDGRIDASQIPREAVTDWQQTMNSCWNRWLRVRRLADMDARALEPVGKKYAEGFAEAAGLDAPNWVPIPTERKVGAVVTAMNEEKTLPGVLAQLERLPLCEIIVVINGSTDHSFAVARRHRRTTVICYPDALGHDVGRAIGAKASVSDIVLFLDGDFPVMAEHLVPFIADIEKGTDVALNDITPYMGLFAQRDAVTVMKEFMNRSLGRSDLAANSLTAVPHALSRRAIEMIGYENLAVPPKAQAKAIRMGLKIRAPMSVDVISRNRLRGAMNVGLANPVSEMIIGDHIEALDLLMRSEGSRLSFRDVIRRREWAGGNVV